MNTHTRTINIDEYFDIFGDDDGAPRVVNASSIKNSTGLRLAHMRIIGVWDQIDADTLKILERDPVPEKVANVIAGLLNVDELKRRPHVCAFFLRKHIEFGFFTELYAMEVMKTDTGAAEDFTFFACSVLMSRLTAERILTGTYVFKLIAPTKEWTNDTVNDKDTIERETAKTNTVSLMILKETCVLSNFYFKVEQHSVEKPLYVLNL